MTYHHGLLLIGESNGNYRELFNHARTATYLRNSQVLGCGMMYNVLGDGGCAAYPWVPPTTDGGPNDGALVADNGWYQQLYSTPEIDEAPWYNPARPESAQALGFWINEWTGLDSGHIRREVTATNPSGGQFGRTYSASREMGFEVVLLGESEAALDYLFQWLDATISSVCASCQTDSIVLRRICPDFDVSDLDRVAEGAVEMRKVGMISGLVWGPPPVERAGCFIRRVNFTMGAMDPCMYSMCEDLTVSAGMDWDTCFAGTNVTTVRSNCRPSCSEMPGECRTTFDYTIDTPGASGPIVTLTPPSPDENGSATIPVRIRTYANPNGLLPDELCGAPLLGEAYITSLPAFSEVQYDMAGRQIRYRDSGTGDWINGFAFVEPNTVGVPRFPGLACGDYTTIVEPASFCYDMESTPPPTLNAVAFSVVASGGRVLIGGGFTAFDGTDDRLAALSDSGYPSPAFAEPDFNARVDVIVPYGATQLLVGGGFATYDGVTLNGIVRTDTQGNIDPTFNTGASPGIGGGAARVYAIAVQGDGKIIIGGDFTTARGVTKNNLARLNADGSLDATYNVGGTVGAAGAVRALVLDDAERAVVGGVFTAIRGTTKNRIARLTTVGALDATFNIGGTVGANASVYALAIQTDGKILVGGDFTTARGTARNRLVRLEIDGTLDVGFVSTAPFTANVRAVVVGENPPLVAVADGRVAFVGSFGAVEASFVTNVGGIVYAVDLDDSGRILIAGEFTTIQEAGGDVIPVVNIARMLPNGQIDMTFTRTTYIDGITTAPSVAMTLQERQGCA